MIADSDFKIFHKTPGLGEQDGGERVRKRRRKKTKKTDRQTSKEGERLRYRQTATERKKQDKYLSVLMPSQQRKQNNRLTKVMNSKL